MARRDGQFTVEDFFSNGGGLNTSDSPFSVSHDSVADGVNFEYVAEGAFRRRLGHTRLATADTLTRSLGLGLWDKPGSARQVIRAAQLGTAAGKLQVIDPTTYAPTALTSDEASPSSNVFPALAETTPVTMSMFNSPASGVLWASGANATNLYGVYSSTKFTANGSSAPVSGGTPGSFTITGASGGTWPATGLYAKYMATFVKASTGAESNGTVIGASNGAIATSADKVALTFGSGVLTAPDTTKYTKMRIYRYVQYSAFTDNLPFTGGDLIAEIALTGTFSSITVNDLGTTPATTSTTNAVTFVTSATVPNAGFTIQDNSVLPSGTYNVVTTWKQSLVTASGNTVYISDTNKPESWPLSLRFNVPSGGDIQALAVVAATSVTSAVIDTYLMIFKQNEVYVLQGTPDPVDTSGLTLNFLDSVGAVGPAATVYAEGSTFWVSSRGIYAWNGNGKPLCISRPIKDKFLVSGDIDQQYAKQVWGIYKPDTQHVVFCLSSKAYGENKLILKADLKRVNHNQTDLLNNAQADGVITQEIMPSTAYAGLAYFASATSLTQSWLYADSLGYLWSMYVAIVDSTQTQPFSYTTQFLHLNTPFINKKLHKVLVYFKNYGPVTTTCNLWSDWRFQPSDATALVYDSNISGVVPTSSLWGFMTWGSGQWSSSSSVKIETMTFNSKNVDGNDVGTSFRLQLVNTTSNLPIEILGYSVYYTTSTS